MKEVEGGVWRLAWLPAPATISAGLRAEPGGGGAERERRPGQAQGTRGEDLEALLSSSHPDVQWRWQRRA